MFVIVSLFLLFSFIESVHSEEKPCKCAFDCDDLEYKVVFVEPIKCPSFPQLVLQPHETEIVFDVASFFTEKYVFYGSMILDNEIRSVIKEPLEGKVYINASGLERRDYVIGIIVVDSEAKKSNACYLSVKLLDVEIRSNIIPFSFYGGGKCLHYPPGPAITIDSGFVVKDGGIVPNFLWKQIGGTPITYRCDPERKYSTSAIFNITELIMAFVPPQEDHYEFEFLASDGEENIIQRTIFRISVFAQYF